MAREHRPEPGSTEELYHNALGGSLDAEGLARLKGLYESNSAARREFDSYCANRGRLAHEILAIDPATLEPEPEHPAGDTVPPEDIVAKPTPRWLKITAAALVAIIILGLFATPFLRLEAPLLQVIQGNAVSGHGNAFRTLEEPGEVRIPAGVEVEFVVRGGSRLAASGPVHMNVRERGPAAEIELLKGTVTLSREKFLRECFLVADGLGLQPHLQGGKVTVTRSLDPAIGTTVSIESGLASFEWNGTALADVSAIVEWEVLPQEPTVHRHLQPPVERKGVAAQGVTITVRSGAIEVTKPEDSVGNKTLPRPAGPPP